MGLLAVMTWAFWCGGRLPTWVWCFIVVDMVLSIPRTVDGVLAIATKYF